jgi:hypothetical protein
MPNRLVGTDFRTCSGLSTSMIWYPARNSFDSGTTPSVIGSPFFPARTSLASLGHPRPSVETNTPESFSSLLNVRMNESHIRPKILLRPLGISLEIGPLAVHHQNVFHFLLLLSSARLLAPPSPHLFIGIWLHGLRTAAPQSACLRMQRKSVPRWHKRARRSERQRSSSPTEIPSIRGKCRR